MLTGATVSWDVAENQGITPYILFARDGLIDNSFYTIGADYGRAATMDTVFDWNLEVAAQFGDIGTLDAGGSVIEAWWGYGWGDKGHHRVHLGGYLASGDDDASDSDADGFVPLFGDGHAMNRLGDLDFIGASNVTDLNVGYRYTSDDENHSFNFSVHDFTVTDEMAGADDDLGTEFNINYGFQYSRNTAIEIGVATLSSGDALGTSADDVQRAWAQLKVTW